MDLEIFLLNRLTVNTKYGGFPGKFNGLVDVEVCELRYWHGNGLCMVLTNLDSSADALTGA